MRLELALIVGILFFCSWCAYIVARMNASVSAGEPAPGPLENYNQANWTSSLVQNPSQQAHKQSHLLSEPQSVRHQVQQHHFGAGAGLEGAWQQRQPPMGAQAPYALAEGPQMQQPQPAGFYQEPNLTPISGQRQAAPAARWQTYALPTRLAAASEPEPNQFGPAPELLDAQAEGDPPPAADYEDEDTAASDYVTPQQQLDETAAVEAPDDPINEDDEEQGQPETGSELDELAQRRLFNELESDSSERDQDGNLLLTRRRHLINGKPVSGARRRRRPLVAENDESNYAESARDNQRAAAAAAPERSQGSQQQAEDFERLVGEFEREDELRKLRAAKETANLPSARTAPAPALAQQAYGTGSALAAAPLVRSNIGGRPQWSVAEKLIRRSGALGNSLEAGARQTGAGRRMAASGKGARAGHEVGAEWPAKGLKRRAEQEKGRRDKGKKDEHEHRLQETLEQQQWDDDAAASSDERPQASRLAARAPDEERVSDIVEQDEEARQLEDMSRELMLNPQFAELTRRRRSIEARSPADAGNENDGQRWAEHERTPAHCSGPCDASDIAPERPQDDHQDEPQEAAESASEHEPQPAAVDLDDEQVAQLSPGPLEAPQIGAGSSGSAEPKAMSADNEPLDAAAERELSLEENVADELEKKVAASNRSKLIVSEIGSPLAPVGAGSGVPAEIVSGQEDMQVEILAQPPLPASVSNFSALGQQRQSLASAPLRPAGPSGLAEFPRVASPFPSGSTKVGKKKKARKYANKRSKLIDSKYKAARAYANKQRSKQKKGQMKKKKRKSQRKLIAGAKHFAGSTHGHKRAHGRGLKGARKGSTYFKDKGYKKRGFKKAYHKLETGDHKTYFDEFRDKDHNKKWKDFDDKHKYSQRKKWAGKDVKHLKHHDLKEARGRASKSGRWKESARSGHMKRAKKYRKANKVARQSYSSGASKKKTKNKQKRKK